MVWGNHLRTADEIRERAEALVEAAITAAKRVDRHVVRAVAEDLARRDAIDERTLDFLRNVHELVLATATALGCVLDAHVSRVGSGASGCCECGTGEAEPCRTLRRLGDVLSLYEGQDLAVVDEAEVWRRANAYFTRCGGHGRLLVLVDEFADGYVARPAWVDLPPPPKVSTMRTERVLIVDKVTGEISNWPLMTTADLAIHYSHQRGKHVDRARGTS
jgi:hypothetical protein